MKTVRHGSNASDLLTKDLKATTTDCTLYCNELYAILPVVRLQSEAELRCDCFSEPPIHSWRFCCLNRKTNRNVHFDD